jgi:hypothetical protein
VPDPAARLRATASARVALAAPAAFAMLTALVLVYLSMLRILASFYGGRRS